jgi:hypothetical protein
MPLSAKRHADSSLTTPPAFVATTTDQLQPAVNSEYLLHFTDTKCSLPCPQQPITKPYHETTFFTTLPIPLAKFIPQKVTAGCLNKNMRLFQKPKPSSHVHCN